jgi:hypothetical protein
MQYIALIYTSETNDAARSEADTAKMFGEYFAFNAAAKDAGVFIAGDALQRTHAATTVRVREGELLTTDGPFAETKEQLGGYYLLECKNLDEAIEWAAKIPGAKMGSIEVRPIMSVG